MNDEKLYEILLGIQKQNSEMHTKIDIMMATTVTKDQCRTNMNKCSKDRKEELEKTENEVKDNSERVDKRLTALENFKYQFIGAMIVVNIVGAFIIKKL